MQNDGHVSPLKKFLSNKWVKTIIIINATAIIIIVGILIFNATKTATINFNVAPIDAKIQIDGQGEYYNGSYQIHPGHHEFTISHEGLAAKTLALDLESGHNATIATFLSGENHNFEYYELKNNYSSFQQLATIASTDNNITTDHDTSAEVFISDIQHSSQLMRILPIIDKTPSSYGFNYGINYAYDYLKIMDGSSKEACAKTLCLYITDTLERGEDFALSIIERLGYNPDWFQIIYEKVGYEDN